MLFCEDMKQGRRDGLKNPFYELFAMRCANMANSRPNMANSRPQIKG